MSSLLTRTSSEGATGTLVPLRRLDDLDEKAVFLPIRPAPGLAPGAAFLLSGRCWVRANAMHPSRTRTNDLPRRDRRLGQPFPGSGETTAEGLSVRPYQPPLLPPTCGGPRGTGVAQTVGTTWRVAPREETRRRFADGDPPNRLPFPLASRWGQRGSRWGVHRP